MYKLDHYASKVCDSYLQYKKARYDIYCSRHKTTAAQLHLLTLAFDALEADLDRLAMFTAKTKE